MRLPAVMTVMVFLIVNLFTGFPAGSNVVADTPEVLPLWGPYITGTTETETVINWKTEDVSSGVVQYAAADDYTTGGSYTGYAVSDSVQLHHVRIEGLRPDTVYHYRLWIIDGLEPGTALPAIPDDTDIDGWLSGYGSPVKDHTFRTLGAAAFTFAVYGDTHEQTPWFTQMERHKLVADRMAADGGISFIVHIGDFTYDAGNLTGWDDFFASARDLLADTTIYPAMGNHDTNSPLFYEIFGSSPYYSFDCGGARFTVLDSNTSADYEAQTAWLKQNLNDSPGWEFVFYHHPGYTSDARNYGGWQHTRDYWESIFISGGIDAVFSGHVHAYEHYVEKGIDYFNIGAAGGVMSDLDEEKPDGYINSLEKTLGYARVEVGTDETVVDFVEVARISEDSRTVLDVFPADTIYDTVTLPARSASAVLTLPQASFQISPASVNVTVPSDGSQRFTLDITADRALEILVGTGDLPFTVKQEKITLPYSAAPQKVELEILGNSKIPDGAYEGKLTFRPESDEKVVIGIKIKILVNQVAGNSGQISGFIRENMALVITAGTVVAVLLAAGAVYLLYRSKLNKRRLILKVIEDYEKNN